jgi:hypothetical protein
MEPIQCEAAYDDLVSVLRQHGLDWVVDQVLETIRRGDPDEVEVAVLGDAVMSPDQPTLFGRATHKSKRGSRERLQRIREFGPCERLCLLATAVRRAIIEVNAIEVAVFEALESIPGTKIASIGFVDEMTGITTHRLSGDEPRQRRAELQQLDRDLIELQRLAETP